MAAKLNAAMRQGLCAAWNACCVLVVCPTGAGVKEPSGLWFGCEMSKPRRDKRGGDRGSWESYTNRLQRSALRLSNFDELVAYRFNAKPFEIHLSVAGLVSLCVCVCVCP